MGKLQLEISRPFRLGGFATGDYMCKCMTCGGEFTGDKRAMTCLPCVADRIDAARSEAQPSGSSEVERDMTGETVCGFRVAAWRETHPEHGDKYGWKYSEHWSTPSSRNPAVRVERLFTEAQLRAARSEAQPSGYDGLRQALAEAIEFAEQDWQALTPEGDAMLDRWRAALTFTASLSDASPSSGDE